METLINPVLKNFSDLSPSMLEEVGERRWRLLQSSPVKTMLRERFLLGTLKRNRTVEDSIANVIALASRDTPDQGFAICNGNIDGFIGIASIQHELPVREQTGVVPTRAARRLPVLSEHVEYRVTNRSNVSAWINPEIIDPSYTDILASVYTDLARLAGRGVWTLSPYRSPATREEMAIRSAGYAARGNPTRYDDGEATGLHVAPVANLFVAGR